MKNALIIQKADVAPTRPAELVLLFHGVGSNAENLRPLGELLAREFKHAWVVSVRSPLASELGGWQWFSVHGITEADRPARVAAAMPSFVESVRYWQRVSGVDGAATTLIGFSQGAIMALEATQLPGLLAQRVIAIAGRFAQPPRVAPSRTELNLLHGDDDRVMPVELSADAAARLVALRARITLDRFARLGHGIDSRVAQRIVGLMGQRARPETG